MKRISEWWRSHFLDAELFVSLLIGFAFIVWQQWMDGETVICALLKGNRSAIYGTLASIFGSLLGFVITARSVILGFSMTERLAVVRNSKHYPVLWDVFLGTTRALGIGTGLSLIALVLDRDNAPQPLILQLCVVAIIISASRLFRCVWILEKVVMLLTVPAKSEMK